jgi:DNA mismatch repair protein MutS2
MTDKTLEYIDYLKLLRVIQTYASTSIAQEQITDIRPSNSETDIIERQDRVGDVIDFVTLYGPIPLGDIPDIRGILKRLALEELELDVSEFLLVAEFLNSCRSVIAYLRRAIKPGAYIEALSGEVKSVSEVAARIAKTIKDEGFIEDSASYELSKIRSDLYQMKERAKRTLERIMEREDVKSVLQDDYVAIRNDRYVIPAKPNYNQFFQGIVHDYSHSMKTSFVEPMEIVELNNTISMLTGEEEEEEKRVLRDLTQSLRPYAREMENNLRAIADLDFHHALAHFSVAFNCVRPRVQKADSVEIRGAINPFIFMSKKERSVPIDILIGNDKKAAIISGPNADGKTVALKTAGLLVAMASSGLFIPAKGTPRVRLFPGIYAVIGDEQDISLELSTFTAHIEAIRCVYEQASGGEMVLID